MKKYIVSRETLEKWKYTGLIKYIPTDLPDCHCAELRKRVEELEEFVEKVSTDTSMTWRQLEREANQIKETP